MIVEQLTRRCEIACMSSLNETSSVNVIVSFLVSPTEKLIVVRCIHADKWNPQRRIHHWIVKSMIDVPRNVAWSCTCITQLRKQRYLSRRIDLQKDLGE
jgi:fumarate reductase subunit D